MRPLEPFLPLSPSFSSTSLHLKFPNQQTDRCSLRCFHTFLIIQDSGVTVEVTSYKIPHPLGFLFIRPVSLWLTDQISDHHISLGGIEDSCLELCHCNIQTRRCFNINETTIILLGCNTGWSASCGLMACVGPTVLFQRGVPCTTSIIFCSCFCFPVHLLDLTSSRVGYPLCGIDIP